MLGKRPSEAQDALLKRYLLELTQSFMIPLVSCPKEQCFKLSTGHVFQDVQIFIA